MTPQERHEDVMRRYPFGLTFAQFQHETLASADADGILDPPALADWFKQQSMLLRMDWDGLIERTGPQARYYDKTGPWRITDKGRAALGVRVGAPSVPPSEKT